jgi:hypothetical protein
MVTVGIGLAGWLAGATARRQSTQARRHTSVGQAA